MFLRSIIFLFLVATANAAPALFSFLKSGVTTPQLPTANLVARYEPSGFVPQSGTLTGWNDSSGLGNHIVTVSGTTTVETAGGHLMARFAASNLTLPTSLSFNARSLSIYIVVRRQNLTSSTWIVATGDGSVASFGWASNGVTVNDGSNKFGTLYSGFNRSLYGIRCDATNTRLILNGAAETLTVCGAATQTGGRIGIYPPSTGPFTGDLEAVFIYSAALTDQQLSDLRSYVNYTYKVGAPDLARAYIMEGDSITVGFGLPSDTATNTWPSQWERLKATAPKWVHRATTGTQLTTMLGQAATEIDPYVAQNSQYTQQVAVLFAGSNDISNARTDAQIEADLQTWCTGRRSAGFDIIAVFTILPSGSFNGTMEAYRVAYNNWLRANYATYADILIDVAADSRLSTPTNTTYYQADATHPNATGLGVIAELAYAAGL